MFIRHAVPLGSEEIFAFFDPPARRGRRQCMTLQLAMDIIVLQPHDMDLLPARSRGIIAPMTDLATAQTPPYSTLTAALLAVRDQRDRAAFGLLFDHFAPRLKAMLLRGGLRDGSADDVVQDVMLNVWHKAAQFDPARAEASAWIYRIARNRQIDLSRRKPLPLPELLVVTETRTDDATFALSLREEAALLHDALAQLPPEQQGAIRQAYVDDLPHSQISAISGLPLGTIKSRIRLALERLRHELRDLKP